MLTKHDKREEIEVSRLCLDTGESIRLGATGVGNDEVPYIVRYEGSPFQEGPRRVTRFIVSGDAISARSAHASHFALYFGYKLNGKVLPANVEHHMEADHDQVAIDLNITVASRIGVHTVYVYLATDDATAAVVLTDKFFFGCSEQLVSLYKWRELNAATLPPEVLGLLSVELVPRGAMHFGTPRSR